MKTYKKTNLVIAQGRNEIEYTGTLQGAKIQAKKWADQLSNEPVIIARDGVQIAKLNKWSNGNAWEWSS